MSIAVDRHNDRQLCDDARRLVPLFKFVVFVGRLLRSVCNSSGGDGEKRATVFCGTRVVLVGWSAGWSVGELEAHAVRDAASSRLNSN